MRGGSPASPAPPWSSPHPDRGTLAPPSSVHRQNLKVCFNDIFDISNFLIQIIMYKYGRSSSTMFYWVYSGIEIYFYKNNMARCVTTGVQHVATFKKSLTNAKRYNSAPLFGYQIYQCSGSGSGGQEWLTKKIEKIKKFNVLEVLDLIFWGLKASSVAWTSFMEA